MLVFHELDLLVLRPFVKKKIYSRTPHRVHARAIFKTRRATGSLRITAGFGNSGNIFTKDQRILVKKGIFKGASLDGKNNFVLKFLTFSEKYMFFGVEPPLGEIAKVFF